MKKFCIYITFRHTPNDDGFYRGDDMSAGKNALDPHVQIYDSEEACTKDMLHIDRTWSEVRMCCALRVW